jgi:hypothetical protein
VFASLFQKAEATVDHALVDLSNRILIAIPFIVALGFAAASLSIFAYRTYGLEIGNLLVAAAFVVLGGVIAIVVRVRKKANEPVQEPAAGLNEEQVGSPKSIFDNEQLMGIASTAAPILLPALLRTATKNWPLVLAVAAGLYVFSLSEDTATESQPQPPPQT